MVIIMWIAWVIDKGCGVCIGDQMIIATLLADQVITGLVINLPDLVVIHPDSHNHQLWLLSNQCFSQTSELNYENAAQLGEEVGADVGEEAGVGVGREVGVGLGEEVGTSTMQAALVPIQV